MSVDEFAETAAGRSRSRYSRLATSGRRSGHLIVAGERPSRPYTRPTPTRIPHYTADTGCIVMRQPRIRHNDYTALDVIPAFGHQDKLDLVLAGLAAQSYPDHLMEVIVDHAPGRTRR